MKEGHDMKNHEENQSGKKPYSDYSFPNEIREEADAVRNTGVKSEKQIRGFVKDFPDPDHILLLGSGDCYFTGFAAAEVFERLAGITAKNYEAYDFYVSAPPVNENSIAIGFSSSGKSIYTIQSLKVAAKSGAATVSISNHRDSPLAKASRYQMVTDAGVSYSFPTKTTTSALMIYFMLALEYAMQRKKIDEQEYRDLWHDLTEKLPDVVQRLVGQDDEIFRKPAEMIAQSRHALYVGSGLNRICALVGAAKIVETSRKHVTFSNAEEYLHLFGFAVRENDAVVIACNDRNNDRELLVADYALKQGAAVIVMGNEAVHGEFPEGVILVDNLSEDLSTWSQCISSLVCLHLLASRVSDLNGKNPDIPDHVDVKYVIDLLYTGPVSGWQV
jgi:glucosamine 6-phosphate synthetase-like amidotransferase/phosphosugar isomerase protein